MKSILFVITILLLTSLSFAKPIKLNGVQIYDFATDFAVDTPEAGYTVLYTKGNKFRSKADDGSTAEVGGISANTDYVSVDKYIELSRAETYEVGLPGTNKLRLFFNTTENTATLVDEYGSINKFQLVEVVNYSNVKFEFNSSTKSDYTSPYTEDVHWEATSEYIRNISQAEFYMYTNANKTLERSPTSITEVLGPNDQGMGRFAVKGNDGTTYVYVQYAEVDATQASNTDFLDTSTFWTTQNDQIVTRTVNTWDFTSSTVFPAIYAILGNTGDCSIEWQYNDSSYNGITSVGLGNTADVYPYNGQQRMSIGVDGGSAFSCGYLNSSTTSTQYSLGSFTGGNIVYCKMELSNYNASTSSGNVSFWITYTNPYTNGWGSPQHTYSGAKMGSSGLYLSVCGYSGGTYTGILIQNLKVRYGHREATITSQTGYTWVPEITPGSTYSALWPKFTEGDIIMSALTPQTGISTMGLRVFCPSGYTIELGKLQFNY